MNAGQFKPGNPGRPSQTITTIRAGNPLPLKTLIISVCGAVTIAALAMAGSGRQIDSKPILAPQAPAAVSGAVNAGAPALCLAPGAGE